MAQVVLIFDCGSVSANTVTFAPAAGIAVDAQGHYDSQRGALAAGTPLGTLTVAPPTWNGAMSAAGPVTLTGSGCTYQLAVGPGGWAAGSSNSITVTATP